MDLLKLQTYLFSQQMPLLDSDTMVYCFAHHVSMLAPMMTELKEQGCCVVHILNNETEMSGVAPYETIEGMYTSAGFTVVPIPFSAPLIQTKNESAAVVQYAQSQHIKRIVYCAPLFHIFRAGLTLMSTAIEQRADFGLTAIILPLNRLNTLCVTHQGRTQEPFATVLQMEYERIEKYIMTGDILPAPTLWRRLLGK